MGEQEGASSSGHTSTPTSHDAMRICPEAPLAASPHACFDMLADVRSAQSINFGPDFGLDLAVPPLPFPLSSPPSLSPELEEA